MYFRIKKQIYILRNIILRVVIGKLKEIKHGEINEMEFTTFQHGRKD